MPFSINNCIVSREFIVITYSSVDPPNFGPTPDTNSLALTVGQTPITFPSGSSHTFYSAIPASIISFSPPKTAIADIKVGKDYSLTVTDSSGSAATVSGFVIEGAAEAIALLTNNFDLALNQIANAVSGVQLPDPSTAIGNAANTIAGVIAPPPPPGGPQTTITGSIASAAAAVQGAINAPTFPLLTEEIGYPPSPLAGQTRGTGGAGGMAIGQVVGQALNNVLGWKLKADDPKGFLAALNASFTYTQVEGRAVYTWQPRTYVVQSDIAGGITGAQASIFARAKDALDQSLPLLNGLYPLNPAAEPEQVYALREIVRDQLTQIVNEFGYQGGPRVARVNTYFTILLGNSFATAPPPLGATPLTPQLTTIDSDQIGGTLGTLRDTYGIFTARGGARNGFINTLDDEQDTTNFRVLADYVTSLAQSWINNIGLLAGVGATTFFGTQLVLISRQLTVVSEDVDEVRFALDSVFIGPDERQAMGVNFLFSPLSLPPAPPLPRTPGTTVTMFFEDFAGWAQSFMADEAPKLIQSGGIIGVRSTVLPIIQQLEGLAFGIIDANNPGGNPGVPLGFHTDRVQETLRQLDGDLIQLFQQLTTI